MGAACQVEGVRVADDAAGHAGAQRRAAVPKRVGRLAVGDSVVAEPEHHVLQLAGQLPARGLPGFRKCAGLQSIPMENLSSCQVGEVHFMLQAYTWALQASFLYLYIQSIGARQADTAAVCPAMCAQVNRTVLLWERHT